MQAPQGRVPACAQEIQLHSYILGETPKVMGGLHGESEIMILLILDREAKWSLQPTWNAKP